MAHQIIISSTHGSKLLFARMSASEQLGRLFTYDVHLLSDDSSVDLRKLLGQPMTIQMQVKDGVQRHFNGIVAEASQTGFETIDDVRYAVYGVTLVPKPWLLSRVVDCRIYKDQSVPDIVRSVLAEIGYADVKLSLSANYPKREYCVQYREDSLNFISRLMEQEGIYYFFTHTATTHTMVLADALGAHQAVSGFETLPYCPPTQRGKRNDATVSDWSQARTVNSLKYQLTDYDPVKPKTSLLATESVGGADNYHGISGLEVFDYPGPHSTSGDAKRYAQVRVEALNASHLQYSGSTDASGMSIGALFKLADYPDGSMNQEYLITGTQIHLEESGYTSGDDGTDPFFCSFQVIQSAQPFRSMPTAVKPSVSGLQTAVVTGSETEEDIVVDKYGRVQVRFHWNKVGKKNSLSSCPVRVASPWAGKGWGAVSIPRVGQEVVVSFLEGDPDRPLIIGSVYNADNMPPYALPENKTQSGIKSRSLDGSTEDFNEIRLEDKKGSEEMYLHAQKDMREKVENDHFVQIDRNEKITIKNDQTENISGNRKATVGKSDELTVSDDGTTSIGKKFQLTAGSEIELVTGASSLVMKSDGTIELKGVNIKVTGSVSVKVEGQAEVGIKAGAKMDIGAGATLKMHSDAMLEVAGGAMATVKGPMLMLKGDGMAQLSGGIVMIG